MSQRRPILIWLLLGALVTGGVVGPVVHRVQHGARQIANRADTPCHTADLHRAEGLFWNEAAEDLHRAECDLCATRVLVVQPTPGPTTAPRAVGTTTVETRSHVAAVHVGTHRFIRGPPSLSEARPV